MLALLRLPLDDYVAALRPFAAGWTVGRLATLIVAAAISWWVYVPLHELAHAFGCLLGGGTVSRLDIDPLYGAALLQHVFAFVHVGSDYAGQLSGFDTGGSDLTYLLTDFLPFIATIVIGVPLLRAAARPGQPPIRQAVLFGAALPVAFAPFVSLTGDFYEMGSIVISRCVSWIDPSFALTRWRSDDLPKLADQLFASSGGGGGGGDIAGLAASFVLGVVLAFLTYAAGVAFARVVVPAR